MSDKIKSAHGSGGKLMNDLIEKVIRKSLGAETLQMDDASILKIGGEKIAFTTDTYTISPMFFPGGDIGSLSVYGTVNDLSVMGARPLYISCGVVLEEGLEIIDFEKILKSMKEAAQRANVKIVTGDTKVVEKGSADKIFINTAGIGIMDEEIQRQPIEPGDRIIINGHIGDHGISVMAERKKLSFRKGLVSDSAPLNILIQSVISKFPRSIKFMRDPTRGGVASVLNEIVKNKNFGAKLYEDHLPLKEEVKGVCEILGIDPLYAANEGKVILIVKEADAWGIAEMMKTLDYGKDSAVIGEITGDFPGKAYLETSLGGKRILPLLLEEQLPRIC